MKILRSDNYAGRSCGTVIDDDNDNDNDEMMMMMMVEISWA